MQIYDIIKKKRNGFELSKDEYKILLYGYLRDNVPDYQMSAFLMSVYFRGMSDKETFYYTDLLLHSGTLIQLNLGNKIPVDKHSTGGVGDKVSIPLAPLVAAAGVPMPMISGRGLGHTGGTLDKLESIPGFNVNLTQKEFIRLVKNNNMAMMGQTSDIVPLDKKLYALRDVTGTIESLPLIVGSILSKKIAEGAKGIVFDVKTGSGAFMQKKTDAIRLGRALVQMSKQFGSKSVAFITDMEQPLGNAIGNSLEIIESIELLKNNGPEDLKKIIIELGGYILLLGKKVEKFNEGRKIIRDLIEDGTGLEWLKKMVRAQGGNPEIIRNLDLLPKAKYQKIIYSTKSGYIHRLDALSIGQAANRLGAGRDKLDSKIDHSVGIVLKKKIGDEIQKDQPLAVVHYNEGNNINEISNQIQMAYQIKNNRPKSRKLILKIIR